ncbi:hypothetical protein [Duganella flavida]|uniref:hypothetical protein n=1 Tax=Duganella flavida TaxID=2692175 RepID=UPI001E635AD6|nr:hypothetical protein [Duganella flavida]
MLLLLLVLGMGAAGVLMQQWGPPEATVRVYRTHATLVDARDALIGYATTHGRLPRPAISASDGRERDSCQSEQDCTGLLPWVTLGVNGVDSWGRLLHYSVSRSYTEAPLYAGQTLPTKRVSSRADDGQPYYLVGADSCALTNCAPAVVFSSGKNGPAISAQGVVQQDTRSRNPDEQQNNSSITDFFSRRESTNPAAPGGEFDDQVVWVTQKTLQLRMYTAGVLL